ncbi:hypothetical protein EVAR_24249_1 [Eumeta japonica]|uniref:Uncharacterized protein n=1 Tax=Eumeta variegata TaxID=151549 RepID=A0A4C1VDA5_EUMVA|nr:hypothetical protein EVAR_24249_1 [Eumeta japonica]
MATGRRRPAAPPAVGARASRELVVRRRVRPVVSDAVKVFVRCAPCAVLKYERDIFDADMTSEDQANIFSDDDEDLVCANRKV